MWKLMLLKRRHVCMLLAGSALVHALVYLQAVNGEPYKCAREWVSSDPRVLDVTGSQHAQGLNFWHGYDYSFGAAEGSASLELNVEGDQGEFNVSLVLQKRQGRWIVVSAMAFNVKGEVVVLVGYPRAASEPGVGL